MGGRVGGVYYEVFPKPKGHASPTPSIAHVCCQCVLPVDCREILVHAADEIIAKFLQMHIAISGFCNIFNCVTLSISYVNHPT